MSSTLPFVIVSVILGFRSYKQLMIVMVNSLKELVILFVYLLDELQSKWTVCLL